MSDRKNVTRWDKLDKEPTIEYNFKEFISRGLMMRQYTDLVFDLYGTLVDIHTDENDLVWEKTALFFGYYGANYTGNTLRQAFCDEMIRREAMAGQSYECFPDIPFEDVMEELFKAKGIMDNSHLLGIQAAQLFRITSTEYLCLYPNVIDVLQKLKRSGFRLWLLSNAQQIFTAYELKHLGLENLFDGIYLSSDYGCRKPDSRFFRVLLQENNLDPASCLMIGNDRMTDIAGAKASGMATLYMHTGLTPQEQTAADPTLHPLSACDTCHWEYEGSNWLELGEILLSQKANN